MIYILRHSNLSKMFVLEFSSAVVNKKYTLRHFYNFQQKIPLVFSLHMFLICFLRINITNVTWTYDINGKVALLCNCCYYAKHECYLFNVIIIKISATRSNDFELISIVTIVTIYFASHHVLEWYWHFSKNESHLILSYLYIL